MSKDISRAIVRVTPEVLQKSYYPKPPNDQQQNKVDFYEESNKLGVASFNETTLRVANYELNLELQFSTIFFQVEFGTTSY